MFDIAGCSLRFTVSSYTRELLTNEQKLTELSEISSQAACTCMICALSGGEGCFKPADDEAADHEGDKDCEERTHTQIYSGIEV